MNDLVLPFVIGAGSVRGRLVRLEAALDELIARHDYPEEVALRVGETVTLAAALAAALKFAGIFTLQIQAEGAIPLIVADATSDGDLRAYARHNREKLAAAPAGPPVPRLFGKGYLAFTIDQGPETPRSQGIVELAGDRLEDSAERYFRQSEQIETAIVLAVAAPVAGRGWRAAAVMAQRMPLGPGSPILTADEASDQWQRTRLLLGTLGDAELLDPEVAPARLLHRLFHAERLVIHAERPLRARCRCSEQRVARTLASFPKSEIAEMVDESGDVVVTCEFCKRRYVFTPADLDNLYAFKGRVGTG